MLGSVFSLRNVKFSVSEFHLVSAYYLLLFPLSFHATQLSMQPCTWAVEMQEIAGCLICHLPFSVYCPFHHSSSVNLKCHSNPLSYSIFPSLLTIFRPRPTNFLHHPFRLSKGNLQSQRTSIFQPALQLYYLHSLLLFVGIMKLHLLARFYF